MSNNVNPSSLIAALPMAQQGNTHGKGSSGGGSWFEAMAQAWGQALDKQAGKIEERSAALAEGVDDPKAVTQLSAESLRMSFLASSSHTSISSVGSALETMARKQ